MAEETTQATPAPTDAPEASEGVLTPVEATQTNEEQAPVKDADVVMAAPEPVLPVTASSPPKAEAALAIPAEPEKPQEPDTSIQPFIDKAFETIQQEVEIAELDKFLRAHIKTFREEWESWSECAKDAYVHMMASQLLQRKAASKQIMIGNEFKLPIPSAQTALFESIKQSQIKPKKCIPVLLMPPNLRPTYSLKK